MTPRIPVEPELPDRYQVLGRLGSGGMANVYRARDTVLDREVAIKVLRATSTNDVARARFASEARTLAGLRHPHLVLVLDAITESSDPYLVMELVDGPTLGEHLREVGPLNAKRAAVLGTQLADALTHAHSHGVIHRDVKPGNILLRPDGDGVLADFGIARLAAESSEHTLPGEVIGSPAYLAPEQVSGAPATAAVDIYSLGLVLVEATTGVRAFPGPPIEAAVARLTTPPAIPESLGAFGTVIASMITTDPARRPTASAVRDALAGLRLPTAPVSAGAAVASGEATARMPIQQLAATRTLPVREPPTRRTPWTLGAAAAGVVAALLLGGLALSGQSGQAPINSEPVPSNPPASTPSAPQSEAITESEPVLVPSAAKTREPGVGPQESAAASKASKAGKPTKKDAPGKAKKSGPKGPGR